MQHLHDLGNQRMFKLFYLTPNDILPNFEKTISLPNPENKRLTQMRLRKVPDPPFDAKQMIKEGEQKRKQQFERHNYFMSQYQQKNQAFYNNSLRGQSQVYHSKMDSDQSGEVLMRTAKSLTTKHHKRTSSNQSQRNRKKQKLKEAQQIKGCPICSSKQLCVQYYGYYHICVQCRKCITTPKGFPVHIYLDDNYEIVALAKENALSQSWQVVDHTNLFIFEKKCYASFAGERELIVLLYDQ